MTTMYMSMLVFAILAAGGLLIYTSGIQAWKKLAIIGLLMFSAAISYRAVNMMYGYPSMLLDDMDDVLVLGFWPDKPNNTIYVWVKEHDSVDPIAYYMPYNIKLHKQMDGMRAQFKGKPYRAKIRSKNYPLEKFNDTVDEVEIEPLPMFPPKTTQ